MGELHAVALVAVEQFVRGTDRQTEDKRRAQNVGATVCQEDQTDDTTPA